MTGGGALGSSVTLEEIFAVVGAKRVPLAPELAGYLVLEIAEHADPSGGDVDPRSVFVGEEGTVALVRPRREAASGDAEGSIRATLARLLETSGSQTPALAATARRASHAGLQALSEEIEAALIPVNRAAGRRALARLAREVKRVTLGVGRNALSSSADAPPPTRRSSPSHGDVQPAAARRATSPPASATFTREEEPTTARGLVPEEVLRKATPADWSEMPTTQFEPTSRMPSPSQADVDSLIEDFGVSGGAELHHARELKAVAGLEPTPPPAGADDPGPPEDPAAGAASNGDGVESILSGSDAPERRARQLPTQPSQLRKSRSPLPSLPRASTGRAGTIVILAVLAVAGGAYGVSQLRPGSVGERALGKSAAPAVPRSPEPPVLCRGTLVVTDVPAHAEVLVRKGQAPVDVEKMPVGARLEFVATAEGYTPRRVVVPAGASWDPGADAKPRFEAAVQLEKSKAKGTNDPWPPGEPGSEVGGQGPPGTVHVVATPRGAEVWMLAGIGPEVRIEQLRCDQDIDLLVAGPTTLRKRIHVATSDFVLDDKPGAPPGPAVRTARVTFK